MTEAQAIEAISQQFIAQWPTASSGVPFALENEALPSADTFALMTTVDTTANQASLGTPGSQRWRRQGYVMVKIWVPADQGRNAASVLADAARTVFQGKALGGSSTVEPVNIGAGATRPVGVDGRWYMLVVTFPFYVFATS